MQTFFVQIKCALGRTYEVANALAEAEIASEIYSIAGDYRHPRQVLCRSATSTSAISSAIRSRPSPASSTRGRSSPSRRSDPRAPFSAAPRHAPVRLPRPALRLRRRRGAGGRRRRRSCSTRCGSAAYRAAWDKLMKDVQPTPDWLMQFNRNFDGVDRRADVGRRSTASLISCRSSASRRTAPAANSR